MRIVFSGLIFSHYGQAYVHLQNTCDWAEDVWKGQVNGLLGAAQPTTLFLTFGLHTGSVFLEVKIANQEPGLDESWDEIVEASFSMPETGVFGLCDWNGDSWTPIPLKYKAYRVRYCARDFGKGEECFRGISSSHPTERYELTFWPSPYRLDRVIKVTSLLAEYWHDRHDKEKLRPNP